MLDIGIRSRYDGCSLSLNGEVSVNPRENCTIEGFWYILAPFWHASGTAYLDDNGLVNNELSLLVLLGHHFPY